MIIWWLGRCSFMCEPSLRKWEPSWLGILRPGCAYAHSPEMWTHILLECEKSSPEYFDLNQSSSTEDNIIPPISFQHDPPPLQQHYLFRSLTIIDDCHWITVSILKRGRWCVNWLKRCQFLHLACFLSLPCFFFSYRNSFLISISSIELNPSLTSHGHVLVFCQQTWKGQSQVATKWHSFLGSFAFSSQIQSS